MELVTFRINRGIGDHSPLVIAPIGDIQWAGIKGSTAKENLKQHLDKCQKLGAYYVGLGDMIDFLSPSNRTRLRAAALYDNAEDVIDDKALDLVLELYELFLKETKGRWIGMVSGHHYHQLKTGDTTDMRLCQLLGAKFLGSSAYIRVLFNMNGCVGSVVLFVHHGVGGGGTAGAPINKLEKLAMGWEGADVFMMGHTTKMPVTRMQRPYPRWHGHNSPDLVHRDILLVNTGGFSKGHVVGSKQGQVPRGYYPELGMMNPAALGAPILKIEPYFPTKQTTTRVKGKASVKVSRMWTPRLTVEL